MIRELKIKNYKSILDHTIELGRVNVFIGENGCGKTNILEAMAMAGAVVADKLDLEELYTRGIRVARPAITFSSFLGMKQSKDIKLTCEFDARTGGSRRIELCISAREESAVDVSWYDKNYQRPLRLKPATHPLPFLRDFRGAHPHEDGNGVNLDELNPDERQKFDERFSAVLGSAGVEKFLGLEAS